MLARLSAVVAPEVPRERDLAHHWAQFLDYYASRPVAQLKREPVEETRLVFHLQRILRLLLEEQQAAGPDPVLHLRPCLEFLLHRDLLDTLVTLCQADSPPGIRPFILNVFIFLLEQLRYPLLPEAACHQPLRRLVLVCALTKASPTETQEVRFLAMLCAKVRATPDLIHIFLAPDSCTAVTPCSFDTSREASGLASRAGGQLAGTPGLDMQNIERLAINVRAALDALQSRHALAAALCNYLDSADYVLALQAMQALLQVAALPSDLAAQALVTGSPFLASAVGRLEALHAALPADLDYARVEEVRVGGWAQLHHLQPEEEGDHSFPGRPELLGLLSFLDYLDSVARAAHPFVAARLGQQVAEHFLEALLQPRLESELESEQLVGLALTGQVWLHIQSEQLALAFSCWLLGPLPPGPPSALLLRLLAACRAPGPLGLEAMRLLDTLLSTPCPYVLDRLATLRLEGRGYHQGSCLPEAEVSSWSDIEDDREQRLEVAGPAHRLPAPSRTLAPSNIHRIVNAWLFLVPDALRLDEVRGSGYDQYVEDARRQVEAAAAACTGFDWPREATCHSSDLPASETSSSDSRSEADRGQRGVWTEGPFLGTMLDLLAGCLDATYDSNLGLTSVLARLAALPHPHLHEFLLNPLVPLVPGARSLPSVLREVAAGAVARAQAVQHFPRKMMACRRRVLGAGGGGEVPEPGQDQGELLLLEAVLVLDEFCKELAAITFVKYHHYCADYS